MLRRLYLRPQPQTTTIFPGTKDSYTHPTTPSAGRTGGVLTCDMVEIDPLVEVGVQKIVCRRQARRLDDERLTIHYEDGLKFVRSCENQYDLIIVDSTDPSTGEDRLPGNFTVTAIRL